MPPHVRGRLPTFTADRVPIPLRISGLCASASSHVLLPEIRRARIDTLNIYEISETGLEILERGSPDSIYLNFAIFLLSVAPSFVVSLLTTKIESDRVFYIFVVVAAVAAVLGAFFLVAWRRNRQSIASVVAAIRNRMPPLGEARDVHTIDVPS